MPTISIFTTNIPQQGCTSSIDGLDCANKVLTLEPNITPPIQTSNHNNILAIIETYSITPNRSTQIGEGTSTLSNIIDEDESNNHRQRTTFVTITSTGLIRVYNIIYMYNFFLLR